ncbi:hypothetical protein ACTFIY_010178 [Dictyostelium cf. discoideum]
MEFLKHYEDDEDQDDENVNKINKRQHSEIENVNEEIPDLPLSFFENFKKIKHYSSKIIDETNKKTRLFEHVEGNYPTFIYFKVPTKSRNDIKELIEQVKEIGNEINIKQDTETCFHISISRTFPIREHHIETFTQELKKTLKNQRSIDIQLSKECCVFINDNQSRIFLSIPINQSFKSNILKLIERIDSCLSLFKFPKYYDNPEPHLSISWSLITNETNNNNNNNNNNNDETNDDENINYIPLNKFKNKEIIRDNLKFTDSFKVSRIFWNIGKTESFIDLQ